MKFKAKIKKHDTLNAAYIDIPFDVESVFGSKRVKVKARFNKFGYRGSIVNMNGCSMIGITQEIRKKIGKGPGDIIDVEIVKDKEARTVEIPPELKKEFKKSPQALKVFEKLSYTHKKEYVRWILEAKKEETRKRRVKKTIDMLNKDYKD